MKLVIVVVLTGALVSLCVGIATALLNVRSDKRLSTRYEPVPVNSSSLHWNFTVTTIVLGCALMASPQWWYGPSWSYFQELPHNGFGMGLCLSVLSGVQALALWLHMSVRVLSLLFFLNGFVYWVAGIILGAEGLIGHQGLIESFFMFWAGGQGFSHSAALRVQARHDG